MNHMQMQILYYHLGIVVGTMHRDEVLAELKTKLTEAELDEIRAALMKLAGTVYREGK